MSEDIFIIKNYLKCMEFSINYQTYFEINYEQTKEFYNSIHKLLKEIKELNKLHYDLGKNFIDLDSKCKQQQKEIEEKSTIIMAGAEKVKQLEKGNQSLMESRIKWKNRYYKEKAKNKECISKDKIREIFQFYIERDSLFNDDAHKMAVIRLKDVLQELLEEK